MVKENNTTITINDIEYDTNDFTDTQNISNISGKIIYAKLNIQF